jgi:succinate dehydrogenase / fumarate reductase, flavoprotein subunit
MTFDSKVPSGPVADRWTNYKKHQKLINPVNKRKYTVLVVGTGLAGASAAASLAELGYTVKSFCFQDSPRRAHSIAAQGGINAAKNYRNDGDSIHRLFYDTIKGGDFRARESNVHRLAEVSVNIIDQCVAQGVPFAREYGGLLDTRSFGGSQLQRTFYCRGQTGQQLLLGAYQALSRQIYNGAVKMHPRTEMLDLIVVDGYAKGIVVRDLVSGQISSHIGDAVVLATGGYCNAFYLSTNAIGCNVTATYRAHKRGAYFANPCYTQIHPTCIPVSGDHQSKLTLMSESLRNDGRMWSPTDPADVNKHPNDIPDDRRDYFLERLYPSYGNLAPRDISSRAAKRACDDGRGVGPGNRGVYLDFGRAIQKFSQPKIAERYGNLFDMYERITGENAYQQPMRIYPALHYTMGGLWVNYELMSNVPGLFVIGEANFSDHGANRLGASALMQGLADGYFVLPYTITNWLEGQKPLSDADSAIKTLNANIETESKRAESEALQKINAMLNTKLKKKTAVEYHRECGQIMWNQVGMSRTRASCEDAIRRLKAMQEEFRENLNVPGSANELNVAVERAGRVADFLEFGELLALDALRREESCGGHFREEHQYSDGEAMRDDERYGHVAAWEYAGDREPIRHEEQLTWDAVKPSLRSYK